MIYQEDCDIIITEKCVLKGCNNRHQVLRKPAASVGKCVKHLNETVTLFAEKPVEFWRTDAFEAEVGLFARSAVETRIWIALAGADRVDVVVNQQFLGDVRVGHRPRFAASGHDFPYCFVFRVDVPAQCHFIPCL